MTSLTKEQEKQSKTSRQQQQSIENCCPRDSTEIQQSTEEAITKAEADFISQSNAARRKALEYETARGTIDVKHESALETDMEYKLTIARLEGERLTALSQAADQRKRDLIKLEQQVKLERDLLLLQRESLALTVNAVGAFAALDTRGMSEGMVTKLQNERKNQQQMAMEASKYLVESGKQNVAQANQFIRVDIWGDVRLLC